MISYGWPQCSCLRVAGLSVQGHNISSRSPVWPIDACVRYVESDGMTSDLALLGVVV